MTTTAIVAEEDWEPIIAAAVNTGKFVTDGADWDWDDMDKNNVYTVEDHQEHEVKYKRAIYSNRGITGWSKMVKLDKTTRDFIVQIRCKPTSSDPNPPVVMEHIWGYRWDNYMASEDGVVAWSYIGAGMFSIVYGIDSFPGSWTKGVFDFPPPGGWPGLQPVRPRPRQEYATKSKLYMPY